MAILADYKRKDRQPKPLLERENETAEIIRTLSMVGIV